MIRLSLMAPSRQPRDTLRRRRNHFFHPRLQVLEDRVAPAAFTVNTFADTNAVNLTTGADSTGHFSLRSTIQAANHLGGSNTISVPAGTVNLTLGQLSIKNNLTITGAAVTGTALNGNLTSSTIINARLASRVFHVFNGFTVVISNVTLEQGAVVGTASTPGQGGAIFNSGALTLKNDTLFANFAHGANGAAGTPGANGADATSTTAATAGSPGGNGQPGGDAEGGAIYLDNAPGAGLSLVNCTVHNNAAFQGEGGTGGQGGNGGSDVNAVFDGVAGAGGAGGAGGPGGNAFGGGVYNAGGSLVLQNSVFTTNFAGLTAFLFFPVSGGGTGGAGGSAGGQEFGQLPSSTDVGGAGGNGGFGGGDSGGAIFNSGSGAVTIIASSFVQNSAIGEAGGSGGAGSIGSNTTNSGNSAAFGGSGGAGGSGGEPGDSVAGAIDNLGTMSIDSSSFVSNQAVNNHGGAGGPGGPGGNGGIGTNSRGGDGGNGGNGGPGGASTTGAIEFFRGSLTLTHSTVSLNTAQSGAGGAGGPRGAGGIGLTNGTPGSAGLTGGPGESSTGGLVTVSATPPQIFDTIIAGNKAPVDPDVSGSFSSLGHNLIGDGSSSTGFTASGDQVGTSTKPIDAQLTVGRNFLVPQQSSPALQAGDSTNAPATDERGQSRIVDDDRNLDSDGPKIDIGAVEFQPTDISITVSGSPSSASPGGIITYTITVKTGTGDNPSVTNLTLADAVPAQTTFQSFTAPGGWAVTQPPVGGTGAVKATFVSLGTSSTVSFTLKVKVNNPATAPSTANTATITTTSPDPTTADNSASVKTVILVGWLAAGADAGGPPEVKVFDPQTGTLRFDFLGFDPSFHGGVRVAVGDVNGDGIPDIIAAQGPGDSSSGDSLVHVYDGSSGQPLAGSLGSFDPFSGFHGGLYVASADLNGDGFFDVVVAEDAGGQPRVKVYSGKDGSVLDDFLALDSSFTGGVRLAVGDVNGDGHADIVAAAGPGGPPLVEVFEGSDLAQGIIRPVLSFDAYDPSFTGGVYVATGDVHGDGIRKILTGAGPGGEPRVQVFDGITGQLLQSFLAFAPGFAGGVRVAAADVNGDGRPDIVAAEGPGGVPRVRGFDGLSLDRLDQFLAFDAKIRDGVFVGGGGKWGILNPDRGGQRSLPFTTHAGTLVELPAPGTGSAVAATPTCVVTPSAAAPAERVLPTFPVSATPANPFGASSEKHRSLWDEDAQLQDLMVEDILSQRYGQRPLALAIRNVLAELRAAGSMLPGRGDGRPGTCTTSGG
jgi:uncharacterized repeat protein (TIGR01451 family)